jgi:hypothetical protein
MKITKARLKEIIKEELEREVAADPEYPDFSVSGAEDLKRSIAQRQAGRELDPQKVQETKEELLVLYQKMRLHGETKEIMDMIEKLELQLQDIEI